MPTLEPIPVQKSTPTTIAQASVKTIKENLKILATTFPQLNEGMTNWLKQELKVIKTSLMNLEDSVHGLQH